MGPRRHGREMAVQFLYLRENQPTQTVEESLKFFWEMNEAAASTRKFADKMIQGVMGKLPEIDAKILALTENWNWDRIALVDKSILRLAIYELLFCDDIPPVVSINEAIEVAKRFSTPDSGKFVNGILDRLRKDLTRPARQAAGK